MFDRNWDATVRNAAFEWLKAQVATYGDVLPRTLLADGFPLDGARIPLLSPQGIFKPRVLRDAPLSITTAPNGPYDDAFGPNDLEFSLEAYPGHPFKSIADCVAHVEEQLAGTGVKVAGL